MEKEILELFEHTKKIKGVYIASEYPRMGDIQDDREGGWRDEV